MGTMEDHPEADAPVIYLEKGLKIWFDDSQILEDLVSTPCSYIVKPNPADKNVLNFVFNWKTGETVLKKWTSERLASSFNLISTSHYLNIVTSSEDEVRSHAIQVRTLESDALLATYWLPSLASTQKLVIVFGRVDSISTQSSDSTAPHRSPFISLPHPRLILFHFIINDYTKITHLHLVALVKTFLRPPKHLKQFADNIIPWAAWGPTNTRCFFDCHMGVSTHMYRIYTEDQILDFNPVDIARDKCRGNVRTIRDTTTVISKSEGLLVEDVISGLPFRAVDHGISFTDFLEPILYMDESIVLTSSDAHIYTFIPDNS